MAHIEFEPEEWSVKNAVHRVMDNELAVFEEGYQFSPAYKRGYWDGKVYFYDKEKEEFPTGLLEQVEVALGGLQNSLTFQYNVIYDKPDKFIDVDDMDKEIKLKDKDSSITLRDYQYDAVKSIVQDEVGIINVATNGGKTEIASGIIQQLQSYLERGETIAFFTHSKEIFNQSADRISERLGIKVGKIGDGKKDIRQVNVVMIPTINKALTTDPEAGLKLSAKQRKLKRLAKDVAPKMVDGFNQKMILQAFIKNMSTKKKTEQELKGDLEDILYSCGTDKEVKLTMRGYVAEYTKLLQAKNGKVYQKRKDIQEFMKTVTVMIVDEAHHTSSDSWYNSLLTCTNAQYRIALTGSIDKRNKVLWQRMQGLFRGITVKTTNQEMIARGISAKPTVTIIPIMSPSSLQSEENYMKVYDEGIAKNLYRNMVIAKLTKREYDQGKGILIIVNRVEHGEALSELLKAENIVFEFLHGTVDDGSRKRQLSDMRSGKLKVLIATSLIDEGVDIAGINTLILGAGGKSMRQVLQRVGRVLRKKQTGENVATVYDFMDLFNKHTHKHSKERRKIYLEEGFEIKEVPLT